MQSRKGLLFLLIFPTVCFHSSLGVNITERQGNRVIIECPSSITPGAKNLTHLTWFYQKLGSSDPEQWLLKYNHGDLKPTWESEPMLDVPKMTFDPRNSTLEITSTLLSDTGTYSCRGFSAQGSIGNTIGNTSGEVVPSEVQLFNDVTTVMINDVPSIPPGKPTLTVNDARSITVKWQPSVDENNSNITKYIIILIRSEPEDVSEREQRFIANGSVDTLTLKDLDPYTEYQVQIEAVNKVGSSKRGEMSDPVRTDEEAPSGKPRVPKMTNTSHSIWLQFGPPPKAQWNGVLQGYHLEYNAVEVDKKMEKEIADIQQTSENITGLEPFTMYSISLQVYNSGGLGPAMSFLYPTDEGVPIEPRISNIRNHTEMLQVEWERPVKTNGKLLGYHIYWTLEGNEDSERIIFHSETDDTDPMTHTITGLENYRQYQLKVAGVTSKGVGKFSSSYPGLTDVVGPSVPLNVTLTHNLTVINVRWVKPAHASKEIDRYLVRYWSADFPSPRSIVIDNNELLQMDEAVIPDVTPNMRYWVQVAGEAKSLFLSDKYFSGEYSAAQNITIPDEEKERLGHNTPDAYTIGIIAGVVCSAVVLVAIVIFFIFTRRFLKAHYQFVADPDSTTKLTSTTVALPESYDESEQKSIPVSQFEEHVTRNHADGDLMFSQEYDDINQATRIDIPAKASADPENKMKNRYINIVAYDHNRVVLKPSTGRPKGDYINANYVDGYHKPRAYIAAQGPLPTTFADFWWMVWEENSAAIIMITNLTERGRRKCDQYWPSEGEHQYGQLSVKLLDTYVMAYYTVRLFNLKNTKLKRKSGERLIKQFHYTSWPDHGVPDYTLPVLKYVKKSSEYCNELSGPPIVHCSAGVGRTGTYIVIDSMIRQIQEKQSVSAFGFLSHIRNQRNYLVQTEDQYIYIHDALLEHLRGGDTEVMDTNLAAYIEDLYTHDESGVSLLQKQYKLVSSYEPEDYQVQTAMMPVNIQKNRSKTLLPIDSARVRLPVRPAVDGSDFINATYLQGYNKKEEYIVTQHPLQTTVHDFWRMVWDQNSMTIVLLSQADDQDLVQFWPKTDSTMDCGNFKVTFTEEMSHDSHVTRDFLLQSTQDDYECTTRMISTSNWPECCSPLSGTFELVQTVKQWHQLHDEVEGPIIVVDRFGGPEAGTFCALSTLYENLRQGGSVDVYMTAKLYYLQRPGIFPKEENYHFLYKVLNSVCEDSSVLGEKDSGISNCNNYPSTPPLHLSLVRKSTSRGSAKDRQETTM